MSEFEFDFINYIDGKECVMEDSPNYIDEKEYTIEEDKNISYTLITSDDSSEDPFASISSDSDNEVYYRNCADVSDDEWENHFSHTNNTVDSVIRQYDNNENDLNRLSNSIKNHHNNISDKYFTVSHMMSLNGHSKPSVTSYNPMNLDDIKQKVDRFLSSVYACSSNYGEDSAGIFLKPVLSKKTNYNSKDGIFIFNKLGLLDSYISVNDTFDDITNKISKLMTIV